jgi:hypothetical protein
MAKTHTAAYQYRVGYQRGWNAAKRGSESALERADLRGEPSAWYDGYLDYAAGREQWHLLHCTSHDETC